MKGRGILAAWGLVSFGLACTWPGCAGPAEKYESSCVSAQVEARTGHDIGAGSEPGLASIPDGIDTEDGVDEDEAIALALWNNAAFQGAVSSLGFERADLMQAGLLTNPFLYVLFPLGPKQFEFTLKLPLEVMLLRPRRLAAAELDCEKAASLLVESGLGLVRDVRIAFTDLELAREQVVLAREMESLLGEIVLLEEARLRAGDASDMEVGAARVKALKAQAKVAQLARETAIAEERLRGLLGCGEAMRTFRFDGAPRQDPDLVPQLEDCIESALTTRPDLRASELALEAAVARAGYAGWEAIRITAMLDANGDGKQGFEMGPGLEMDLPLFDQGQARRARADAGMLRAAWHHADVKNHVALSVREAHVRLLEAREALAHWKDRIDPAVRETQRALESSCRDGQSSYLEVLLGSEQVLEARGQEAALERAVVVAHAELERQVGHRLDAPRGLNEEAGPHDRTALGPPRENRGNDARE